MTISLKFNTYHFVFLLATLVCLSPLIKVAPLLPIFLIILLIVKWRSGITFARFFYFCSFFFLLIVVHLAYDSSFLIQNAIIAFITYSSFLFLIVIPSSKLKSDRFSEDYDSLSNWMLAILILESIVGIGQIFLTTIVLKTSFDVNSGDFVQGTINPFSFLNMKLGSNNPVFALNIGFLLIFLFPTLQKKRKITLVAVILGVMAIIASSAMHLVIAFVVSITLFIVICELKRVKTIMQLGLGILLALSFFFATQPSNFYALMNYGGKIFLANSPKLIYSVKTIESLEPKNDDYTNMLLGLGPGQYSSRAALIATNEYLSIDLSAILTPQRSPEFVKYFQPTWDIYQNNSAEYGDSTMTRPLFSIMSLISEFGLILFSFLVLFYCRYVLILRKKYINEKDSFKKKTIAAVMISSFVMFSIGIFENYWELTPGIFPCIVILKYISSNV